MKRKVRDMRKLSKEIREQGDRIKAEMKELTKDYRKQIEE